MGMCRKLTGSREKPQAVTWILRVMATLLAMYGLYLFGRKDIFSFMFLKQQFVFFDFEQSAEAVFAEYIAMMGFLVLLPVIYRRGSQVFPHQKTLCRKMKRRREAHDEKNPSTFSGSDLPVENVTWLDAIRCCNARSEKEGFVSTLFRRQRPVG